MAVRKYRTASGWIAPPNHVRSGGQWIEYTADDQPPPTGDLPPAGMTLQWQGDIVSDWDATLIENAPNASITNQAGYIQFDMPTPSSASGDRVELQTAGRPIPIPGVPGDEGYYEWEFYITPLATPFPGDSDGYITINQFHGNENAGYTGGFGITEDMEIHCRVEGGYRLNSNEYEYEQQLVVGDFNWNTWHKIGYHVRWDMRYAGLTNDAGNVDQNPTGFAIAYLDDVEGARVENVPTMGDRRTDSGRVAGTGPTTTVMFRVGWYPQTVPSGGLLMRVRNTKVYRRV